MALIAYSLQNRVNRVNMVLPAYSLQNRVNMALIAYSLLKQS